MLKPSGHAPVTGVLLPVPPSVTQMISHTDNGVTKIHCLTSRLHTQYIKHPTGEVSKASYCASSDFNTIINQIIRKPRRLLITSLKETVYFPNYCTAFPPQQNKDRKAKRKLTFSSRLKEQAGPAVQQPQLIAGAGKRKHLWGVHRITQNTETS